MAKVEDVTEAFDGISYEKGGSFIQMLSTVMGKKNFDKGINVSFYIGIQRKNYLLESSI